MTAKNPGENKYGPSETALQTATSSGRRGEGLTLRIRLHTSTSAGERYGCTWDPHLLASKMSPLCLRNALEAGRWLIFGSIYYSTGLTHSTVRKAHMPLQENNTDVFTACVSNFVGNQGAICGSGRTRQQCVLQISLVAKRLCALDVK